MVHALGAMAFRVLAAKGSYKPGHATCCCYDRKVLDMFLAMDVWKRCWWIAVTWYNSWIAG